MSLTTRALWLLAAITALAVLAPWNPGVADAWPAALLVFVALLFLEGLWSASHPPDLVRQCPSVVELGREFELCWLARATPTSPERLRLADPLPRALDQRLLETEWRIAAGDSARRSFRVLAAELGVVALPPPTVARLGILGLAWWRVTAGGTGRLWVVPQRLSAAEARTLTRRGGETTLQRRGSGLELLSLRPYVPGDPPRMIDWKATARASEPIVRVMSDAQELELVVLLDLGRSAKTAAGPLRRFEARVNLTSRLAQVALDRGDRLGFVAFGAEVRRVQLPVRGLRGVTEIERALSGLRPEATASDLMQAMRAAAPMLRRRCLVVFLCDFDAPQAAAQLLQAVWAIRRQHLPLITASDEPAVHGLRHRRDDDWQTPFLNLAAADQIDIERSRREALARMGARVVAASPEHLDQAVLAAYGDLRRRRIA